MKPTFYVEFNRATDVMRVESPIVTISSFYKLQPGTTEGYVGVYLPADDANEAIKRAKSFFATVFKREETLTGFYNSIVIKDKEYSVEYDELASSVPSSLFRVVIEDLLSTIDNLTTRIEDLEKEILK